MRLDEMHLLAISDFFKCHLVRRMVRNMLCGASHTLLSTVQASIYCMQDIRAVNPDHYELRSNHKLINYLLLSPTNPAGYLAIS